MVGVPNLAKTAWLTPTYHGQYQRQQGVDNLVADSELMPACIMGWNSNRRIGLRQAHGACSNTSIGHSNGEYLNADLHRN
jgi:hypothetical protein